MDMTPTRIFHVFLCHLLRRRRATTAQEGVIVFKPLDIEQAHVPLHRSMTSQTYRNFSCLRLGLNVRTLHDIRKGQSHLFAAQERDPLMSNVFISYRRDDTGSEAILLRDAMRREFGEKSVFMDTSSLQAGFVWSDEIKAALSTADSVI
jgi:hypothetical protein